MQALNFIGSAREAGFSSRKKTLAFCACILFVALLAGGVLPPLLGLKALVGLAVLAVVIAVFLSPILGVYLFALTISLENVVVFSGGTTFVKIIGLLVFGSWILQKFATRGSWRHILSASLLKPALLFILLAFASALWATSISAVGQDLFTTVQLLALSLLFVDVVDSWRRLEWVVRFLILGGLVALLMTLRQSVFLDRAGSDIVGDPNETATYILLLVPLAFYLLRASKSLLWRSLGLVYVIFAPAGIGSTNSRTSFIFLPLVLGSQVWEMSKRRPRNLVYVSLVLLVVGGLVFGSLPSTARDRVLARGYTIIPAIQGARTAGGTFQNSRIPFWEAGVTIFRDHPLTGVGFGNFGHEFRILGALDPEKFVRSFRQGNKAQKVSFDSIIWSPHSSLFGIAAELGLIGVTLWMWLLVGAILIARHSWSRIAKAGSPAQEVLAQAVFYILVAYTLYGVVTIIHNQKLLWLMFGLAEVLRRLTLQGDELSSSAGAGVDTPAVQSAP